MTLYTKIYSNKTLFNDNNFQKLFNDHVASIGGKENIPEGDVTDVINCIVNKKNLKCICTFAQFDTLFNFIVDNFTLGKSHILKLVRFAKHQKFIYTDDIPLWVDKWFENNKNIKFTPTEKKIFVNIGYFFKNSVTQSMFESYFKHRHFILNNLGNIDCKNIGMYINMGCKTDIAVYYNLYKSQEICCEHSPTKESIDMYLQTLPNRFIIDTTSLKITEECFTNLYASITHMFDKTKAAYVTLIYLLRVVVAYNIRLPYSVISSICTKVGTQRSLEFILEYTEITYQEINASICSEYSYYNKYYFNTMAAKIINYEIPLNIITFCDSEYICNFPDGKKYSTIFDLFLTNSNIQLTQEIMNMAIRYNCTRLYHKCIKNGCSPDGDHIKYAILYSNKDLLITLIDNKFIPTLDDIKYNINKAIDITDILNTTLFLTPSVVCSADTEYDAYYNEDIQIYIKSRYGAFEDPFSITADTHPYELLLYAMKFPEEVAKIPIRYILCIKSYSIRLLLFDIIDEFNKGKH
jgi:hypothetical protein